MVYELPPAVVQLIYEGIMAAFPLLVLLVAGGPLAGIAMTAMDIRGWL